MFYPRFALLSLLLAITACSCTKKTVATAPAPDPTPSAIQTTASAAQPAAADNQSTLNARIAAAKAAMQSKEYEKVSAALFAPVNRNAPVAMTGQELMSLNDVKATYLNQLSAAAAAGDSKAKAAMEMLRQQQNR